VAGVATSDQADVGRDEGTVGVLAPGDRDMQGPEEYIIGYG